MPKVRLYSTTKLAFTSLFQQVAREITAERIQMISFHPGLVYTEAAKKFGVDPKDFDFDDGERPPPWIRQSFLVYLASPPPLPRPPGQATANPSSLQSISLVTLRFGLPRQMPPSFMGGLSGRAGT